jgi:hypothetical protein
MSVKLRLPFHWKGRYEKRVMMRIFESKKSEVTGGWTEFDNGALRNLCCSPNIIRVIKWRGLVCAGRVL